MVSLLHLADITEQGVTFASPVDGSRMLLTPEHSIRIQNQLGVPLDVRYTCLIACVRCPQGEVSWAACQMVCHEGTWQRRVWVLCRTYSYTMFGWGKGCMTAWGTC